MSWLTWWRKNPKRSYVPWYTPCPYKVRGKWPCAFAKDDHAVHITDVRHGDPEYATDVAEWLRREGH